MVENVTNMFGFNLCQLRKEAYTDSIGLGPFSIRSTYANQDNQPIWIYSIPRFDKVFVPEERKFGFSIFDN